MPGYYQEVDYRNYKGTVMWCSDDKWYASLSSDGPTLRGKSDSLEQAMLLVKSQIDEMLAEPEKEKSSILEYNN